MGSLKFLPFCILISLNFLFSPLHFSSEAHQLSLLPHRWQYLFPVGMFHFKASVFHYKFYIESLILLVKPNLIKEK